MEKMTVFYDGIRKGVAKKTQKPYQMATFFQIVTNRWGTNKVDVTFSPSDEVYAQLEEFVEENKCIVGDLVEIGVKISKDLTRPPKLVSLERVIEKSPLLKYAVTDDDEEYEGEEDEPVGFVPVK